MIHGGFTPKTPDQGFALDPPRAGGPWTPELKSRGSRGVTPLVGVKGARPP